MGTLPPKAVVYHCSASTHLLIPEQHLTDDFLRDDMSKACYLFNFAYLFLFTTLSFAVDSLQF